jgi:RimJ/RimL family protein N-acetyltransferase
VRLLKYNERLLFTFLNFIMPHEKAMPHLQKIDRLLGHSLMLKNADVNDAAFILQLRTDEDKSRHLSKTENDLEKQINWLRTYADNQEQVYFIIQNLQGENLGTVRLYDQREDSFCWGSWIMKEGAPASSAIESALMVYHYGLQLGFKRAHFDVRKANVSVWKFHQRFGAEKVGESDEDLHYEISEQAIRSSLQKYAKYLPNGVR